MKTLLVLALLLTLAVGAAEARDGTPIDETRKVDRDVRLTVECLAGEITVETWNKDEVQITGTLDPKAEELQIRGGGDRLTIEVEYPDRVRDVEGSDLRIRMPERGSLDVSSVSADVAVDGVRGSVDVETVSGTVTVRGEPADVDVENVSGTIDLDVKTDRASLACVSGELKVRGVRKELECEVVSGDIDVDAGDELGSLDCETVSGDITVAGQLPRGADWSLAAHSGDVTVDLRGDVNAEFEIETFSGEIHDVFGNKAHRVSKYAPGSELDATVGDGGAKVEIEAFSGDVRVRKR
jgi:DUF4097 and DUF4098 domain-containing protein YvlB